MFIPVREAYFELTPEEFEKYSLELLSEQTKGLENLKMVAIKLMDTLSLQ